ncbi:hypothetical protein F5J12DRAFT_783692 [Pisolithus orientalis]|uniref:uncharacterized protein n=1 Tax=Pisolithus orientalis TaxID=936130 RepID=UPI0022245B32|nr:uncharacterized protein F5J12DRAFT_783692 [Pisolithus orientalis]KAI6003266.1 hypothetical protein F5J12DRAFT_783692 [Pisolithus orientalis]
MKYGTQNLHLITQLFDNLEPRLDVCLKHAVMCTAVPIRFLTTTITDTPLYKPIQCKSQYTNHHHLFVKKMFFAITPALTLHDSFFSPLVIISVNLRRWGAFDVCILAKCDDHWITSLNADYVPQPFIFDGETIMPLHDGQFSHIDCFQWPQLFAECYTWSLIHADKWKSMETICNRLDEHLQDWLKKHPHYKEYLDTDFDPAMGTFIDSFDHWIGAFMTDPNICQCLFEICMPVWMVWKPNHVPPDMQVLKTVEITHPHDIVMDPEVFEVRQMLKWHSTWYNPGELHHRHTQQGPAIGLEQFAAPWPEPLHTSSGVASTPTSMGPMASNAASSSGASSNPPVGLRGAKLLVVLNPELWEDLSNPAIPPTMSAWYAALKDMNKDAKRVSPNMPKVAYFFPSLSLFVRGKSSNRQQRPHINQMMKSKILWDLYEHNFQFELVTLDHVMMPSLWSNQDSEWLNHVQQIFPGDLELTMCAEPFPQQNQGLGSSDLQLKWEYVEKLWALLAVWPGCPLDLVEPIMPLVSLSCVWAMEKKLAIFYAQSFFDTFGHLPLLPCLIPTALCGYSSNGW